MNLQILLISGFLVDFTQLELTEGKVKSQNTKIHFESLQNKSVNISNNFLYFLITL